MGIFCFLWLCFGVIFQPFEVIQPEDHCGTVKSSSLVGFHLSWVRLGSHLWIFSAAFRSGSFAGERVYGEVTAMQVITFHKRKLPLISSVSRHRKCPFNILCVLFQIPVEIRQFLKKAVQGITAKLSWECTNASCRWSILLALGGSSSSEITPRASVLKKEEASGAGKYQSCYPSVCMPAACRVQWVIRRDGLQKEGTDILGLGDDDFLSLRLPSGITGSSSM